MNDASPLPAVNWKKNLIVVWLSQFLAMIGFGCCMPFIPLFLRDQLGIVNDQLRGFYVSVYYFSGMTSLCIASAVWGILADRFGRKLMLLRASYAAALFYPLFALSPNIYVLLVIRFICSFLAGTVNPAQTLLVATTPPEKHGFVLGTFSTSIWGGNMLGYMTGGLVVHYFGYTAAFMTCGVIYLISGALVHIFAEEHFVRPVRTAAAKKTPIIRGAFTPGILWLMLMFLLMGLGRRVEEPFVAMQVELVHGKADAAFYTGIASAAAALGGVISGILIGKLCDRYPPAKLAVPIVAVTALATLGQAYSAGIAMFIVTRFFTYLAAGGIQPVLQVMLSRIITPETRGTYFGWTNSVNMAGGILCAFISAPLAYYSTVRGIFAAGALIIALMIPLMYPTARACDKETQPPQAA